MDKRSSEHYKAGHKYKGRLILVDSLNIRDISLSGIQLETVEHLIPDSICRIEITSGDNKIITPQCKVIWSDLRRTEEKEGETVSIYFSGLNFTGLSDSEIQFLEKNIKELASD
jgi:hypothetical protein